MSVGLHKKSAMVMLRDETVSDEQAKAIADGFGVLVQVLKALGTPEGKHQGRRRHRAGRYFAAAPFFSERQFHTVFPRHASQL